MNWTIDDPEFCCGWVSPDGQTFSCSADDEHEELAAYLLQHIVNGRHSRHAKKDLLKQGWVLVRADADVFAVQDMTPAQNLRLIGNAHG